MRVLAVLLLACIFAGALASSDDRDQQNRFTDWMRRHNKVYGSNEFRHRWENWKANDKLIDDHNANPGTFLRGHNKFSDLSQDEFSNTYLGAIIPEGATRSIQEEPADAAQDESTIAKRWPPGTLLDWRAYGFVTGIKNQGQCGSCWSFSATGAMEGFWARFHGALPNLSEQQLVDCTRGGCMGCSGGWPATAIRWVASHGGAASQWSYPYGSGQTGYAGSCPGNGGPTDGGVWIQGAEQRGDLKQALDSFGPISVALDASYWGSYRTGIFACPNQAPSINHAVLAVGYGNDGANDYWIIKNSWDTWWGESGWMRLMANSYYGADCGISYFHRAY